MTDLWKHIVTLQGCYSAAKNCSVGSPEGSRGSKAYWLGAMSRAARQLADECDLLIPNIEKESVE